MIALYGFGPGFGLPEISPYVTKTEVQLQMAGLAYSKQPAMPQDSPKGQLPFIDDDGERIADSTFIRAHIERKYGIDLDSPLDVRQRAQAWAIERMIENHFAWTAGYARFFIPENFEKGPGRLFVDAPEAEKAERRRSLLERVSVTFRAAGILRHSPEEIEWLGVRSLEALSVLLGDKPYLMGERPMGADAVGFAALAALLTPFFDSPLRRRAGAFPNLLAYTDRMMARFYPEFAWVHAQAA